MCPGSWSVFLPPDLKRDAKTHASFTKNQELEALKKTRIIYLHEDKDSSQRAEYPSKDTKSFRKKKKSCRIPPKENPREGERKRKNESSLLAGSPKK